MHDTAAGESVATRLDGALEAYLRANRAKALALLSGCEEWPAQERDSALALRSEALATDDPVSALQDLAAHQDLFSPHGRFEYYLASARAYTNSRGFEAARDMLAAAEGCLENENDSRLPRLAYHRAKLDVITRQFDPASSDFETALRDPNPAIRFMALAWRSWMHASFEDYRAQLADLREAFRIFEREGHRCGLVAAAGCLYAMLMLAWELGDTESADAGEGYYESIAWTPDIQNFRFLCSRALGWDAFMRGESARAQWLFKDSKELAPTDAWKVWAHLDRAYVARMSDNEAWALEELEQASQLAESVAWGQTKGEERVALVTMAVLYAPVDMARAQRYVSLYVSLGLDSLDPTWGASNDRRTVAFEKYAMGCVQKVLGNTASALRSLETAYDTFSRAGYAYRTALCGNALYELTKDNSWLDVARNNAAHYPLSALTRKLNSVTPQSAAQLEELTQQQRQLAAAVCEGLDLERLSQRFSRSTYTIERQLEEVQSLLGARTRAELRAELRKRGLAS